MSEQVKHTAPFDGPWEFDPSDPSGYEDIVIEYSGCPLLTIRGVDDMSCLDEEDEPKALADVVELARVIKSVPDLLKENERLKEALAKIKDYPPPMFHEGGWGRALANVQEIAFEALNP